MTIILQPSIRLLCGMITVDPSNLSAVKVQAILQAAVAPRPIAFASTVNAGGQVNLSPFSFFNVFSASPPILIFSPARRVRDNTTKHTLDNVLAVPEVVISVVSYAMVQQMSLASTEYPAGVNEFEKAGFTMLPSQSVKPPCVKEAPVNFECTVEQVIALGDQGGAGNLVICKVQRIHMADWALNDEQQLDQNKLDLVARLGGNWYCRASGDALFEVEKPLSTLGVGVDQIPQAFRLSPILSGNHLGRLGNVEQVPDAAAVKEFVSSGEREILLQQHAYSDFAEHRTVAQLVDRGAMLEAWKLMLSSD